MPDGMVEDDGCIGAFDHVVVVTSVVEFGVIIGEFCLARKGIVFGGIFEEDACACAELLSSSNNSRALSVYVFDVVLCLCVLAKEAGVWVVLGAPGGDCHSFGPSRVGG